MDKVFQEIQNLSEERIAKYISRKENIECDKDNSYIQVGSGYVCTCFYCKLKPEIKSSRYVYDLILDLKLNEIKYHSQSVWNNLNKDKPEELKGAFISFYQDAVHAMHTFNIQFKSLDELKRLEAVLDEEKQDKTLVQEIISEISKNTFKDEFLFVTVISDITDMDVDSNCLYLISPIHKDTSVQMRKTITDSQGGYVSFEKKITSHFETKDESI